MYDLLGIIPIIDWRLALFHFWTWFDSLPSDPVDAGSCRGIR